MYQKKKAKGKHWEHYWKSGKQQKDNRKFIKQYEHSNTIKRGGKCNGGFNWKKLYRQGARWWARKEEFLEKDNKKDGSMERQSKDGLFQQRERYGKQKVEGNKTMMKAKKSGRLPNLNPSSCLSLLYEDGLIPKARKFGITHSTMPLKPRYSLVKPKERIYGNKWKKIEKEGRIT